jgi:ABC-type transporter Mla subunit MlaD
MALQDLTPQLRTRLRRVERIVTLFVVLAALLLAVGFGYYIYSTAMSKGWFIPKCDYYTLLMSAEGLKVGDPVVLMGFNVGEITKIETQPPNSWYKIFIKFNVRRPYYGYIWSDSKLRVNSNLLGGRKLEILPGSSGLPTVKPDTDAPVSVLVSNKTRCNQYLPVAEVTNGVYVAAQEDVAIADQANKLIAQINQALPGVVGMTNQVNATLANVVQITSNVNHVLLQTQPILTNVHVITANLRDPNGSLGQWLIPTNLNTRLDATLATVNTTLGSATSTIHNLNCQLTRTTTHVNDVLNNVTAITSNINQHLQSNDNLIGNVNDMLLETTDMLRGLKRHWLLKSAFPTPKLEAPPLLLEPTIGGTQP